MKYRLKNEINFLSFLKTVDTCSGDVIFESREKDLLNLKSQLSKILFLTLKSGDPHLAGSKVECSAADSKKLSEFLVIPD